MLYDTQGECDTIALWHKAVQLVSYSMTPILLIMFYWFAVIKCNSIREQPIIFHIDIRFLEWYIQQE